jgi:hypothetical protein
MVPIDDELDGLKPPAHGIYTFPTLMSQLEDFTTVLPNAQLNGENDASPMNLPIPNFQTNPYTRPDLTISWGVEDYVPLKRSDSHGIC